MKRALCLYMPYLSIEQVHQRCGWSGREPIAVIAGPASTDRVVQCNQAAGRMGVRVGMPLTEARAVAGSLRTVVRDPRQDRQSLERLAKWADCLSPVVHLEPPDTLLIDVTGCERLFRGEGNLLRQAIGGVRQQGFTVRGAIADTAGAAWTVARADPRVSVIVPPGQTVAAIASLPVWALGISSRSVAVLDAVGVETIGTLLHLPRASLAARVDEDVLRRLDQVLGGQPEVLIPFRPAEGPISRLALPAPTDQLEVLCAAVDRLLASLCEELARRRAGVRNVFCTLYHEEGLPSRLELGLSRPTRSVGHLKSLLTARLEAACVARAVCGMMLQSRQTYPLDDAQIDLFEQDRQEEVEDLAGLIDRLANRLGADSVVQPVPVGDHQPEHAYRYVSLVGVGSAEKQRSEPSRLPVSSVRASAGSDANRGASAACPRPLRLFGKPLEVPAMAMVPDGPPGWFRWRGQEYAVAEAIGPERLETGWWKGCDIQRDYFRVTSRSGGQFWIFRDRRNGRWFLHGLFD